MLKRTKFQTTFHFPDYYISVTTRDLHKRKERWEQETNSNSFSIHPGLRIPKKMDDPEIGLVAKIGCDAEIQTTIPVDTAHGVLLTTDGLLSASHSEVKLFNNELTDTKTVMTFPSFNALHSLRTTVDGYLITSSGTDAIFEVSKETGEIIWSWWAVSNGFSNDQMGHFRNLDVAQDHRGIEYPVRYQTTHVNSAVSFEEESIIATLFHQGSLIMIDKKTKRAHNILTGLTKPHSVRIYEDGTISVADSGKGVAIHGRISGDSFRILNSTTINTRWLKDCIFIDGIWYLIDSENAELLVIDKNDNLICRDTFNDNWYLYDIALSR